MRADERTCFLCKAEPGKPCVTAGGIRPGYGGYHAIRIYGQPGESRRPRGKRDA